jgi:chemotaxis protein MotB
MRQRRRFQEDTHESTSHDRWLISYADFMTLLFALFVVLFATSYRDSQAIRKVARAIHVGFQHLGAFSGESTQSTVVDPSQPPDVSYDPHSDLDNSPKRDVASQASGVDIAELQRQLEAAIGTEIRNHEVITRVTPEGFVISLKDLGFFNSGEAVLRPGAANKIERIAKVLMQHKMELRIEGHSDAQPIHTPEFRSNWELSTARATAVLLYLTETAGLDPSRISVAGYGQYRPLADNATPEGRQANRRVDLVVVASRFGQKPPK